MKKIIQNYWNKKLMTKNYMNKFLPFLLVLFVLASCKIRKEVSSIDCVSEKPEVVIQKIKDNALKYEWLSSKIDVKVQTSNDNNQEFSAILRIRKDSAIWTAVKVFGIPVATGLVTTDSVKALIKQPSKKYLFADIDFLQTKFNLPADYYTLEDILSGKPVGLSDSAKYHAICLEDKLWLMSHSLKEQNEFTKMPALPDVTVVKYLINKENFYIEKIEATRLKDNTRLVVNYKSFEKIENSFIPISTTAYFYSGENKVQIDIASSKIQLNEPLEMPFSITEKYEPINIE